MAQTTAVVRLRISTRKQPSQIPSIIKRIRAEAVNYAYNFVRLVSSIARARAPFLTGHLKDSITYHKIGQAMWRLVVGAPYGVYVEYGTRHRPAQPFLNPAVAVAKVEARARSYATDVVHR